MKITIIKFTGYLFIAYSTTTTFTITVFVLTQVDLIIVILMTDTWKNPYNDSTYYIYIVFSLQAVSIFEHAVVELHISNSMDWESQRPSAPSTPTSVSSHSTSGTGSSREKIPPYKQLNPSPAVTALSKFSDDELFRKVGTESST